ncbi:MAG: hypothetical protein HY554_11260 [Elusimicrobia bacterium]|nr:hypothetical protein [Elusimicrobiota bacterium]
MAARGYVVAVALAAQALGLGAAGAAYPAGGAQETALSSEFAVPVDQLRELRERGGLSWKEVRTALILSRETGMSLADVAGLRRAGVSFEEIAARHRLELGDVIADYERQRAARRRRPEARQAVRSEPESDRVRQLSLRHGAAEGDVRALRRRGFGWEAVDRALGIAARTGRPVSEVVELKDAGLAWSDVEESLSGEPAEGALEARPMWDSPASPFASQEWSDLNQWRLYRGREPGYPREQVAPEHQRPSR